MNTNSLYPDEIPSDIFQQVKYLVVAKGMTLKDGIDEYDSKLPLYAKLTSSIKDKLREESYRW